MDHKKKMIAPILIGAVVILYLVLYGSFVFFMPGTPLAIKVFFGVFGFCLAGGMIKVIVDRIREIRKGEEDDLSNY